MEKKVYTLNVDPELRDLIPPLTEEEHRMLEDSIVRDGCDTPLVVWNGTIVDGHNRYEICQKHQVPFSYEERSFANKEAAMFWMLEHQLGRRNLNAYQRSHLALRFAPMLRTLAKENQGRRNDLADNFPTNLSGSSNGFSAEKMAEMAGVSPSTIRKVQKIDAEADEATKDKLRRGETSIHKAYTVLVNKEQEGETRVCECCGKEKPISEYRLPSNVGQRKTICLSCEKAGRQENHEDKPSDSEVPYSATGVAVVNGQLAHVSLGLPDEPGAFDEVVKMLHSAQTYYTEAFKGIIGQYGRSMITKEHNDLLQRMIDSTADTIDDLFNTHIKEEQ